MPLSTDQEGIRLRPAAPSDLARLVEIYNTAAEADDTGQTETVAGLQHKLDHPAVPELKGHVLTVAETGGAVVGYHQLHMFSEPDGPRIYSHRGFVHPDGRGSGIGSALMLRAEATLTRVAVLEGMPAAVLSAWCYDTELGAVSLLGQLGYQANRSMLELIRPTLNLPPVQSLPKRLQVRPVEPAHLRPIWEAYLEAAADDHGAVTDSPGAFEAFMGLPQWDFRLWQVAWDGDQIAGMVLNYLGPSPVDQSGTPVGFTEYVAVRRGWRQRGLATALLTRSLQVLRAQGIATAQLDVNEENPSGAVRLYGRLGYRPRRRLTVCRKSMTPADGQDVAQTRPGRF